MIKFSTELIVWYKENKRELPWRNTKDPYCVWVSEVILQQTRVNQGLSYYHEFLNKFPTVELLALAHEDELMRVWQGLGYYSRARNMHHTAKFITNELNGVFPKSYDELIKLKGIGPYTAAAISSICYNEHKTVVDGNVFRVLSRIFGVETPINTTAGKKEFENLAHQLNKSKNPGDFNQAIMEFGALYCTPQKPDCPSCIFNEVCVAYINNKVDKLPVKQPKAPVQKRYLHFLMFNNKEQLAIQKRDGKDIWKGLYQFPLLETEKELNEQEVLQSDFIKDLVSGQKLVLREISRSRHMLSHRHLIISIYNIYIENMKNLKENEYKIILFSHLDKFAFPRPLEKYILNQL